jgi:hypothetical protein
MVAGCRGLRSAPSNLFDLNTEGFHTIHLELYLSKKNLSGALGSWSIPSLQYCRQVEETVEVVLSRWSRLGG